MVTVSTEILSSCHLLFSVWTETIIGKEEIMLMSLELVEIRKKIPKFLVNVIISINIGISQLKHSEQMKKCKLQRPM